MLGNQQIVYIFLLDFYFRGSFNVIKQWGPNKIYKRPNL